MNNMFSKQLQILYILASIWSLAYIYADYTTLAVVAGGHWTTIIFKSLIDYLNGTKGI